MKESVKLLINQSSEYRLSQEAAYISVPIELWNTWSKIRRNKYINFIRNLSKSDLEEVLTKVRNDLKDLKRSKTT